MYMSTDQREFILQTFDGKAYTEEARGPRKVVKELFERLRGSRRIVLAAKARPAKPEYRKPPISRLRGDSHLGYKPFSPNYPKYPQWAVTTYLEWARSKGLATVTVYADGKGNAQPYAKSMGFDVRTVAMADFLGDAPEPEAE